MQEACHTLTEKLTGLVKKTPNKVALQIKKPGGYEKHTYQDLYNNAQAIAKSLINTGVQKGDRVVIVLENRPEWAFIYFGILYAGGIAVPLDPQSTLDDFKYLLEDSESKVVFTSSQFGKIICEAASTITHLPDVVLLGGNKTCKAPIPVIFFPDFLKNPSPLPVSIKIAPDDIASIIYTSGTTGKPKGVMLTHENFYSNFLSIEQLRIFDFDYNVLAILPLHHSFPFMVTLIMPIFFQGEITYISSMKREEIMGCLQETTVTVFIGVPQFFYFFHQTALTQINAIPFFTRIPLLGLVNLFYKLRQLTGTNLNKLLLAKIHAMFGPHLKYFVTGGAKLDPDVELFFNKIGFTLIQGYGLTETSPIVTFNPLKKPKIGSVGKAIPKVEIKIINPNPSGIGEIAICGPNVMKGYYNHVKETEEVLKDRWFYSGDLGYLDREGYLFLTGRKKELIILGNGKNISPEEVETHYLQGKYISEMCVLEIGQDENERLAAVIVPDFEYFKKTGEIDIYNTIKLELDIFSKGYPLYKCIMGFIITKEKLPRTSLGKLKRHEIRDKYQDELMGIKPKKLEEEEMSDTDLKILSSPAYKIISTLIEEEKQLKSPVSLNDHLGMDLGFDSLSRIELISILEKQFNIKIPEELIAKISTVKELVLKVDKLSAEQNPGDTPTATYVKSSPWQNILKTDPATTITDKIDIAPNWLSQAVYLLFCGVFYIIFKTLWRIKVLGIENLPRDKPFILCPNHGSYLDAFLILAAIPNRLRRTIFFLGFHIYFTVPIVRNLIKLGRVIPLDPATNLIDAMRACGYVLRHNKTLCIFPEGNRSPDGSLQPFKKGVGILANELEIQLVPVYIDGSFQALPRGKAFPKFNQIKVTFGKPCTPEQLKAKGMSLGVKGDYEAIARGIEEEVKNLSLIIQ